MSTDTLNMVDLLKAALKEQLVDEITISLVKEMVDAFEKKAEEIVRKKAEKITLDGIDHLKDVMKIREELRVFMHWNEDDNQIL